MINKLKHAQTWLDETNEVHHKPTIKPWRILIVDNDLDIHLVTKFALARITFKNRPLEFISAYTTDEAFKLLQHEADIALILLDLIIEDDAAGLTLIQQLRCILMNQTTRIIIRTWYLRGLEKFIVKFDIYDYQIKIDLTRQRLINAVIGALCNYDLLHNLRSTNH